MKCPCCGGTCLAISQGRPKKTWVCVEGNCTWTESDKDCDKKHGTPVLGDVSCGAMGGR
jgi:hypothetical protein